MRGGGDGLPLSHHHHCRRVNARVVVVGSPSPCCAYPPCRPCPPCPHHPRPVVTIVLPWQWPGASRRCHVNTGQVVAIASSSHPPPHLVVVALVALALVIVSTLQGDGGVVSTVRACVLVSGGGGC